MTLGATLLSALHRHKVKQNEEKLRIGSLYKDQGLVFTTLDGGPVNPRTVVSTGTRAAMPPAFQKFDFTTCGTPGLSLLFEQDVHPKIISKQLGHSEVGITLNIYSHVMPGMHEQTVKGFDERVFGDNES